ncbi:MAG: hypothetical protein QNK23_07120 [Crocinitomicaceae bacterium]|nr:hypothetical protein [Crocinitomicaceae bacterium]
MENQMYITAYAVYLPIALLLTFYVAKSLFKNAKTFMLEIFHGKQEIALATNRLFEIGFYLMNLGFALLILRINANQLNNYQDLIERLSVKLGGFSIYLGIMLFLNLYLLFRGRKKSKPTQPKQDDLDVALGINQ